jgi:hypothetical protein
MRLAVLAFFSAVLLSAQASQASPPAPTATKVAEPDYVNHFAALNADGSLTSLKYEPERLYSDKEKNVSVRYLRMDGEKCPVRLAASPTISFIVRLSSSDTDPGMAVNFFHLAVVDGNRRVDLSSTAITLHKLGLETNTKTTYLLDKSLIKFEGSKYGMVSAKIKSNDPLPAGEYGLAVKKVEGSYCFGID